jgi:hypothetical protein
MKDEQSIELEDRQAVTPILAADAELGGEFDEGRVPLLGGVIDG